MTPPTPQDAEVRKLLTVAYGLLARRAYTRRELELRLRKRGAQAEPLEQALAFLEAKHYVDDARLAREAVDSLQERRGWGREKVVQWLQQRGIRSDLARTTVTEISPEDEAARAQTIAEKLRARGKNPQQIFRFLQTRGFSSENSRKAALPDNHDTC